MPTSAAPSETEDLSARLDRLERMMNKLVALAERGAVTARAESLAGRTPDIGTIRDRLAQSLLEISDPDVLGALTRIATLAPQLEAAAHAAAAAPDLLSEALDVVREKLGDDGNARVHAAASALALLSQPKVLAAVGRIGAAAPALAGPLTAAAQATAEVTAVVGAEQVDGGVADLVRTLLDPEVLQSLVRIAGLAPQLEYAAFGAAALPELLDEGIDVVREKTAAIDDGLPLSARLDAVIGAVHALTRPDRVAHATYLAQTLLPTLDRFAALPLETVEGALEMLSRLARPDVRQVMDDLIEHLPAISGALLALPRDPRTLAMLAAANDAVGAALARPPKKLGLFGLLGALRDPKVKASLGFGVAVASNLGDKIDSGALAAGPAPKQLPAGKK